MLLYLQSLLAFYIWGNAYTFNGIMGIFLVIFGSGLYTYAQMRSPAPPAKAASSSSSSDAAAEPPLPPVSVPAGKV